MKKWKNTLGFIASSSQRLRARARPPHSFLDNTHREKLGTSTPISTRTRISSQSNNMSSAEGEEDDKSTMQFDFNEAASMVFNQLEMSIGIRVKCAHLTSESGQQLNGLEGVVVSVGTRDECAAAVNGGAPFRVNVKVGLGHFSHHVILLPKHVHFIMSKLVKQCNQSDSPRQ